jgi:diacylglycerol O-acyltransferase / wax synthase
MERLNPLDAVFLEVEDGVTHMPIASCAVFEGPAPPFADLAASFERKLPLIPRYRQRLQPVPLGLGRPLWVDDADFDLTYHVRRTALPAPGGEAELQALMARVMGVELDRRRPLWETWMVEGLEGGGWAVISKVHHCMVDGVSGTDLLAVALDDVRHPEPIPVVPWTPEALPSAPRLVADAVRDLVAAPATDLGHALPALRQPRALARRLGDLVAGARTITGALRATPPTSVDGPISPHRRWVPARTSLDDVKLVKRAFGGTVNDVVLAAVAGGWRELLLARGEDPEQVVLRSLIPVSLRTPDARGVLDNRVSALFFELPVQVEDPVERLALVREQMDRLKASHEFEAGEALTTLLGYLPAPVTVEALRLATSAARRLGQRSCNTVVTNIPGPGYPLFLCGREMLEYLPFVPLSHGVRIGVAVVSYDGNVFFGVTGDFDTAPDVGVLARGIEDAVVRLVKEAEAAG